MNFNLIPLRVHKEKRSMFKIFKNIFLYDITTKLRFSQFFLYLCSKTLLCTKFQVSEFTGSTLWILIPLRVSNFAEICDINGCIFWLSLLRSMIFSQPQGTVDLSIWYKFQLDTSTRFWEKGSWQTDGQTDGQQSDPIRVPFFPFEVRNSKNEYVNIFCW